MNRKALSLVMAGVLSASAVIPAFASGTSGGATPSANGTEIWAGVVIDDPDARIKVEVPTLFAFVVNGSVSTSDTMRVSSADGTILLPNVKVDVTAPSGALPGSAGTTGAYTLQTVGDGVMQLTNYSTKKDAGTTSIRVGMPVTVNGNIKNEGTAASRNNWEYVAAVTEADTASFKKYNISIDGNALSTPANGGYEMASAIALNAPLGIADGTNLDATTQLAVTGATKTIVFDVKVGGQRNQYKQVEESAKVGTIVWTVNTEVVDGDFYTAPDNDYLDGAGESGWTTGNPVNDPDDIELQ